MSDRPEVRGRPGTRAIEKNDWPGVPASSNRGQGQQEGEPIELVDWSPPADPVAIVLPPESHALLDKWWQRVDDELAEWEELGRELRGYVERPEKTGKSDRDNFNKQFYWRPTFGEFQELPDREEVHPTESNNEYSQFSEAVLGKMDLVSNVPTYEVVIYDYKHEIWIDSKDMSTPYSPIMFWSYIPEVVSIEFKVTEGE